MRMKVCPIIKVSVVAAMWSIATITIVICVGYATTKTTVLHGSAL